MTRILIALSLFILFSQCSSHKPGESNMKVQVNIIAKLDPVKFKGQDGFFYSVSIDLLNNTDSIFHFWTMTCSWEDNWITETNALRLYNPGCDKNFPKMERIDPGQKINYKGIFHVLPDLKNTKESDFKLGFILIKEKEVLRASDFQKVLFDKIRERKDIIWSDPFKIDK